MSETYRTVVDPTAVNNPHSYAIQLVGTGHRVLEVGCSVGHVTRHLVAAGNTVVGVEIDADAAEEARTWSAQVHVVDLDLTRLTTIESGPFDVIVLGDVLEHLRDPASTLRDLLSLLEPDGRVIISVPHVGFIDVRLMLLEGTWAYQRDGLLDRTHLRWFTKSSLRDLLTEVGLVATRVERVTHSTGASLLPVNTGVHSPEVIRFIEADPEAHTYQFVVEAARHGASVLDDDEIAWPNLADERAAIVSELDALRSESGGLRTQNAAMQSELDAWHNARIVRLTAPLRRLWGSIRQRRSAP